MQPVVKVKFLDESAHLPQYAKQGDAGADLFSIEELSIEPGKSALVGTGIAIELPQGYEAQIRPRSGLALKHQITVLNTPGTVDEGYRAQVGVILINHSKEAFHVKKGMKIAQMVVKPVQQAVFEVADELGVSDRGLGGFGSTGV